MKSSFKNIVLITLIPVSFYAGTFYGEFRWMTLSNYLNTYKSLSYLENIESDKIDELKISLNEDISSSIIGSSTFLNYSWLSPVDTDAIKTAYKKVKKYRKETDFKYNLSDLSAILHKKAEKIINE